MSFEKMCYLIVCRQEANLKRRRLLYKYSSKEKKLKMSSRRIISVERIALTEKERSNYRKQANTMKEIAVNIYSPLRRELKAYVKYNSNNMAQYVSYDGDHYDYNRIKEIAVGYEFDTIVLEGKELVNPYKEVKYE